MTYEKAIEALIAAGYLAEADRDRALAALASTRTEFTYPDWAQALAEANLIQSLDVQAATQAMEQAARQLAADDEDDLDQSLENAGIL